MHRQLFWAQNGERLSAIHTIKGFRLMNIYHFFNLAQESWSGRRVGGGGEQALNHSSVSSSTSPACLSGISAFWLPEWRWQAACLSQAPCGSGTFHFIPRKERRTQQACPGTPYVLHPRIIQFFSEGGEHKARSFSLFFPPAGKTNHHMATNEEHAGIKNVFFSFL